jgi:hypothetical protein
MFSRKKDKDAKDTKKKGESTSDEVAVSDTMGQWLTPF